MADASVKRGPGRPPDMAKRRAILDATLELLAEVGYGAMTIDAVAQRAGSNRVLIYRVWDSKVVLARDALFGSADDLVVPDTGSTSEDLRGYLRQLVTNMRRAAYVNGVPSLTVELLNNRALFRDTYERFVRPSEEGLATILERGRARGEVLDSVDPATLIRIVSGTTTSLAQPLRMSVDEITDVLMRLCVEGLVNIGDTA